MRVIITGGTGLIGRALANSLCADGHEVIILSRSLAQASNLPAGARLATWDARSAAGWGQLADGADAIVNLAGENIGAARWTPERKRRILESRLNAGQAVVQAVEAAAHKPGVVIQASGIGIYGPHGDEELTEESPPGDGFLERVAVQWEACTAPVETWGVRRAIIRSGVVLSKEGGSLPRMVLPFRFFVGGPIGNGRQWFSWIHLADEVRAIRFLMEHPNASGPFNLCSPEPLTNAQFSRVIGHVMGRPAWLRVPAWAMRLLFGEMASILLTGQRAVPRRLLDLGFTFLFPRAEEALRDLLREHL